MGGEGLLKNEKERIKSKVEKRELLLIINIIHVMFAKTTKTLA